MNQFLNTIIFQSDDYKLTIWNLALVLIIFLISKLFLFFVIKFYQRYFKKEVLDSGREHAVVQFTKYIVYVISFLLMLQSVGIQPSLIWGGAAALLVGIGLGLQQTFQDLFSGIILLIEGTIQIGDIIEVDGFVAKVIQIGLRTSKVVTRDNIIIIIPNSKLVSQSVINWSNNDDYTRFKVSIGVAYSSDIDLVESLLEKALETHPDILSKPKSDVQFVGYGNSSLDFDLLFFSYEFFSIEKIKSQLRKNILKLFRQHGVEIPFAQHDIWFRNALPNNATNKSFKSSS